MADGIALDPGCHFRPSDGGLITLFLRPKIAEEPFEERIVNNADVYSSDPVELVGQHTPAPGTQGNTGVWYFFCPPRYTSKHASSGGRRQRAVAGGGSEDEVPPPLDSLDFDLEALLSSPVDENLTRQFSTVTDEQCMRYLLDDEPLPCTAPTTMEVAGAGGGDNALIQTTRGACMDSEFIALLAAGHTVDELLGPADPIS
uniref:NAC domain-containing protein n=1 Tax=Oryza brachyantha TaxID=4533 RepID=J3LUE3_ORYBR